MIVNEMEDPCAHSLVITTPTPGSTKEQVIAWCKWNAPSPKPLNADLPEWPEGADVELANDFFGNLFTMHMKITEQRKHWYLELVATRPEWQGKGAAGKLMRWGLEQADEARLETYLEASPDGKLIYEHFGFKEVERMVVDLSEKKNALNDTEFVEVMMLRPAKGL